MSADVQIFPFSYIICVSLDVLCGGRGGPDDCLAPFLLVAWKRLGCPVSHLVADWSVTEVIRIKELFDSRDCLLLKKGERKFYFTIWKTKHCSVLMRYNHCMKPPSTTMKRSNERKN